MVDDRDLPGQELGPCVVLINAAALPTIMMWPSPPRVCDGVRLTGSRPTTAKAEWFLRVIVTDGSRARSP